MTDIRKIDENFNVTTNLELDDVTFYSVRDNLWCLYGLMLDDMFRRLPEATAEKVSQGVFALHTNTAGGRARFITDSPYVAIVAKMPHKNHLPHMPQTAVSGFDMYVDKRFCCALIPPVDMEESFSAMKNFGGAEKRNITINFPLYNDVSDLFIGIKQGSCFEKAKDYEHKEKIVYYGSSITQGGCVSRPGLSYPAIISNELGCDYVNLGFAGNARGELIMAEYIAGLNPDIFVLDYDHNAPNVEHLKNTHEKFFLKFRSICPDTPVVMVSAPNIKFNNYSVWSDRRDIIKSTYNNATEKGDKNVYFIDGECLWGDKHWDLCSVDGIHPNDLGHFNMANGILPTIEKILFK